MATKTKVLTAHVPLPLADKVDKLAEQLERPRGWIVKQALSAWVAREEERHQMILDALAQVDAKQTVPHEEVRAWVDSLGRRKKASVRRRR